MRNLAILLVLAAAALAQDDAASLFYKGFWLEQAEGKLDEAAALYAQLLKEKPDAPEAPRALLGLVRIKVAKGEDPAELVAELERRYPAAKEEIEGAKRLPSGGGAAFDPSVRDSDSAIQRKLKNLYFRNLGDMSDGERVLLQDLGPAAHPMLVALLHGQDSNAVAAAAIVLVQQGTPEAHAVLARALLDDTILFRGTILGVLGWGNRPKPGLLEALEKLYERAGARLRAQVIRSVPSVLSWPEGADRDRAGAFLARALADDDEAVREAAASARCSAVASDAYLDALLRYVESNPRTDRQILVGLPSFADRAAFRDRIERVLSGMELDLGGIETPHEEAALLVARLVVKAMRAGRPVAEFFDVAQNVADCSPRVAADLLRAALELDGADLAQAVANGLTDLGPDAEARCKYLGAEADKLRTAAIASAAGLDEKNPTVDKVLSVVGVPAAGLPSILEGLRRRGERNFPRVLLVRDHLDALGPDKAGAFVEFCRTEREVDALLQAGERFWKRDDSGVEFYRQVIPRAGPGSAGQLADLARLPALTALVADRMLAATGPAWRWDSPPRNASFAGPWVWSHIDLSRMQQKLLAHVQDPRPEIATSAANAARSDRGDAGTAALRLALDSKSPAVRAIALESLAPRVPDGPALVREFAARADLAAGDRSAVASVLANGPAYAPVAAELIRLGTWPYLWPAYKAIAPKECVELALTEAVGERGGDHLAGALGVLTSVDDPRRIEVFRHVLKGNDAQAIMDVLRAVHDQYLVELGEETLAQLRNPDSDVRAHATQAIDKLKFYADAKRAFEK